MPITPFLDGHKFDPETKHVLGVAFEMVCIGLRIGDCDDYVKQAIADKIINLATTGERNPDCCANRPWKKFAGISNCRRLSWPSFLVLSGARFIYRTRGPTVVVSRTEEYRHLARECLEIGRTFPIGERRSRCAEEGIVIRR
jgi:hypothetical protein